jgi:hypothetical protein
MTKGEIFIRCRGQMIEIYHMQRIEEEDRVMVTGGADLPDVENRGMVPWGA